MAQKFAIRGKFESWKGERRHYSSETVVFRDHGVGLTIFNFLLHFHFLFWRCLWSRSLEIYFADATLNFLREVLVHFCPRFL